MGSSAVSMICCLASLSLLDDTNDWRKTCTSSTVGVAGVWIESLSDRALVRFARFDSKVVNKFSCTKGNIVDPIWESPGPKLTLKNVYWHCLAGM